MNKQELIEKIEAIPDNIGLVRPHIDKKMVLGLVRQLDEPEKVKVPQFVAEHIEWTKEEDFHLLGAMIEIRSHKNKEIDEWFEEDDNMETFARAWLDGYTVEKEKQYIIKLKGVPDGAKFLKYAKVTQEWYFGMKGLYSDREIIHTRKELEEANFGWVFNCEGIEVEEVTE
nr:MAG TPA: Protein of unknown function (DUF1642) [Caudoviricetes sp.]